MQVCVLRCNRELALKLGALDYAGMRAVGLNKPTMLVSAETEGGRRQVLAWPLIGDRLPVDHTG